LDLPTFALDGGEEPEIVGCYVIDENGVPRRLGFALGNEWSDHETERINYLYLAPSKLRTCAVGPELHTDVPFKNIPVECRVMRDGTEIYHSGPLHSGEDFMCSSTPSTDNREMSTCIFSAPAD
jgi:hypothetical protein